MSGDGLHRQSVGARPSSAGYLKVRCRTYRYPTEAESDWDILEGGKTVAVVALTDDDQVVLAKQFRPGPNKVLLELPGGLVDGDEPVAQAALRELLEETGFTASSAEVVGTTFLAAYATHVRYAMLARGCRRVAEPQPGPDEFVETVTMPLEAFVDHALGGQLTDIDVALAGLVAAGVFKR